VPRVPSALRSRGAVAGALALLVLVVAGVVLVVVRPWADADRTRLEQALALAPASTARFSWTDWAAVRRELGVSLSESSSAGDVNRFLDKGFDADLTSESSLVNSADVLQREYGVSPATADWELLAQGEKGSLLIVALPDSYDLDALGDRLDGLGYRHSSGTDGVDAWDGGASVVSGIGDISPQLSYIGIDADDHLLVASDKADYVVSWHGSTRGDDLSDGIGQAAATMGDTVSASVYSGDYACGELAMTHAGNDDRVRAQQLITQAGEVGPYEGFAIGLLPGGGMRVAMAFDTDEQARTNADTRAKLAAGPAPGQGGAFPDRFSVDRVVADGDVVRMDLDPVAGSYPLSDLSSGPVLFATC
jgi:hypothetical protein